MHTALSSVYGFKVQGRRIEELGSRTSKRQREEGVSERRGWQNRKLRSQVQCRCAVLIKMGYHWLLSTNELLYQPSHLTNSQGLHVLFTICVTRQCALLLICVSVWGKGAAWTCSKASVASPSLFCTALISMATTSQERASRMYVHLHCERGGEREQERDRKRVREVGRERKIYQMMSSLKKRTFIDPMRKFAHSPNFHSYVLLPYANKQKSNPQCCPDHPRLSKAWTAHALIM